MTKKQKEYSERLQKAKDDSYDSYIDRMNKIASIECAIYDEIKNIRKEIVPLDNEISKAEKQIQKIKAQRDKRIAEEKECIPNIQKEYEKNVFQYLSKKIRDNRKANTIAGEIKLEDDESLVELNTQREESNNDIQKNIKKIYDDAQVKIAEIEESIKKLNTKLSRKISEKNFYEKLVERPKTSVEEPSVSYSSSASSYSDDSAYSYSGTSSYYSNISTSNDSQAFEDALRRDREERREHDCEEEKRRQREYDQRQKEEDRRRREDERRQQEEARKQAELARKQAEREEYARRMEVDRQRRQQEEAARREAHRIRYYHGIVYFKNGTTRRTGSTNVRQNAERMAADLYNQAMRTAVSDYSKPTRYEVVED